MGRASGGHHRLVGPSVTKTVGLVSQFTLGRASDGQTPEAQLTSSWALSLLAPLTVVKAAQGFPQRLVMRTGQLFSAGSCW